MSTISTHVLDTARGVPASGVPIALERASGDGDWNELASGITNDDGRAKLVDALSPGTYRMTFDTNAYFAAQQTEGFYPVVRVEFVVRADDQHYHVPLLLSPYGYSTYRGS